MSHRAIVRGPSDPRATIPDCSVPALRITLLLVATMGTITRPPRLPPWVIPTLAATFALVTNATDVPAARAALEPLVEPLVFLLAAVPLALLLDRLGFFVAVAARIDRSRHIVLWMWLFAAAVTTVLNLDASVVLLTPLYVQIARRHGLDPIAAAFPPVLLASLASSALPVSNLTNLIVAEQFDLAASAFARRLGPASLAAVLVGYVAYRRAFRVVVSPGEWVVPESTRRAIAVGAPVVAFVVLGFTVGDAMGVPAWSVALVADIVLVAATRRVTWRELPLGAAAIACALGVLAAAAAPELGLDRALRAGPGDELRVFALAAAGANAVNNVPALLVGLPALGADPGSRLWALLLGVNIGPVLVVSGSLAGLLWIDTARRLGVPVDARRYTVVGLRVGGPALLAALGVLLATNALVG